MTKFTDEEINKIREVSIHKILGIRNTGRRISIRCPFHGERTGSFTLYPDNGFHCFGCNANGRGAIDFTMKLGYSFTDAIQELVNYL